MSNRTTGTPAPRQRMRDAAADDRRERHLELVTDSWLAELCRERHARARVQLLRSGESEGRAMIESTPQGRHDELVRVRCALGIVNAQYRRALSAAANARDSERADARTEARRLLRVAVELRHRADAMTVRGGVEITVGGARPGSGRRPAGTLSGPGGGRRALEVPSSMV